MLRKVFAFTALMLAPAQASAAWHEAKSEHFVIFGDARESEIRRFAERLERIDAAIRLFRTMDDPPLTDSNKLTIFMLTNQESIAKLHGSNLVAGFYIPRVSGAVAFVPRKAGSAEWELSSESIFIHEYAHHLQFQDTSVALPEWLVEGFAEFFATAKVRPDGSVDIGLPPQHRGFTLLNTSRQMPVEQLLAGRVTRTDEEQVDLFYGRSWALTHYLTFASDRAGQVSRYLTGMQSGQEPLLAAKNAFGDLTRLDRELTQYIRTNVPGQRVHARVLTVGDIRTRQLRDGEAAIMDVRIRSSRGVNEKTAPGVAAEARKVAASYPLDAAVQAALAEAEFDTKDYKASEAASDRALAADPKSVGAMIYKGRSQSEQAKASKQQNVDWAAIRAWFTRANKVDVEAPEPLYRFYETYIDEGAKPPPGAVDALLYSAVLVPQDRSLRFAAVQQLLFDNKIQQAREWFAPIAFAPHSSKKWRESAEKVMEAMGKGDGKAALSLIEQSSRAEDDETGSD